MEDGVDKGLNKVLKELVALTQQQQDLLSEYRRHKKSVSEHNATEFMAPDANGLSPKEAVKLFLKCLEIHRGKLTDNVTKILNPYQIQPGDVILVRPKNPDTLSVYGRIKWSQTVEMQRKLNGVYDKSCYTHAAISNGYHRIFESVPENGIVRTGYWRYMNDGYDVKIKRLKDLRLIERCKISSRVSSLIGRESDFIDLSTIRHMSKKVDWLQDIVSSIGEDGAYICPALFAAACRKEKINLDLPSSHQESSVVTPAGLNASEALEDVDIDWVSVF